MQERERERERVLKKTFRGLTGPAMKGKALLGVAAILFSITATWAGAGQLDADGCVNGDVVMTNNKTVESLYHNRDSSIPASLDIQGYTLTLTVGDSQYIGTLRGTGTINVGPEGNDFILDNGEDFSGTINLSGGSSWIGVLPSGTGLNGTVNVKSGAALGAPNDVSVIKNVEFEDGSSFFVTADGPDRASKLVTDSLSIGSGVKVILARFDPDPNGSPTGFGQAALKEGRYVILESTTDRTGNFSDTVLTGAGSGIDGNQGMPLLDAVLDQSDPQKVILLVSMKDAMAADLPGVSGETRALLAAMGQGGNQKLKDAALSATLPRLQAFSRDMDSARGALAAASRMAVDTTGPAVMARLDYLHLNREKAFQTGGLMPLADMSFFGRGERRAHSGQKAFSQTIRGGVRRPTSFFGNSAVNAFNASGGVTNGLWARPVYWYNRNDRDGSNPSSEINGFGFAAGYDVAFGPVTLGTSYGYTHSSLDMSRVDGEMDSHTLGLYGSVKLPVGLLFKGWAGYSWQRYDIDRGSQGLGSLAGGTFNRDSDAGTWTASARLSRDFALTETVRVTPFAGINAAWVHEDGFTEKAGNGADRDLAMSCETYTDTKLYSILGAELAYETETWGVSGHLSWNARLAGDKRPRHAYRLAGVDWQESLGSRVDDHSAGVGFSAWHSPEDHPELSLYGGYDAIVGDNAQTHGVSAGIRWEF